MTQIAERRLEDLVSVGPATLRDFKTLGIHSVEQLAQQNPRRMFSELCRANGPQDICCLDVFEATVAQARDLNLPNEKCQWGYWSRKRKTSDGKE